MNITERTTCRSCEKELLRKNVLDLGVQTIVDFVQEGEEGRGQAPLQLTVCVGCSLLQLRHTVDADTLFRKFWYRSGVNEQMRAALKDVVDETVKLVDLKDGDVVVDIGANDGLLLSLLPDCIIKVGCEPAVNLLDALKKNADVVINDYWSVEAYAERMREYEDGRS